MEDIPLLVETFSCLLSKDMNIIIILYIPHMFSGIYYINATIIL